MAADHRVRDCGLETFAYYFVLFDPVVDEFWIFGIFQNTTLLNDMTDKAAQFHF